MDRLRELVVLFMEHHPILEQFENEEWYLIEDGLVEFLSNNFELRYLIYESMKRKYHEDDVRDELLSEENVTEEEIQKITDRYEKYLLSDDGWHYKLWEAINDIRR